MITDSKTPVQDLQKARRAIVAAANGQRGIQSKITCPVCSNGTLRFSIQHNGHIHAACTSADCVRWIE
jgi:hypothetical protein